MAVRQCYIATQLFVEKHDINFEFVSGFSKVQKQKCIRNLHEKIVDLAIANKDDILEVSTKSKNPLGVNLSAFNLSARTLKHNREYTVESAFQSSKVFEGGVQHKDIIMLDSKSAKTDPRLKNSGKLSHFQFFDTRFELSEGTAFYDWLYINVLLQNPELCDEVMKYRVFTDIEFNSKKSMNTQAFAIALFVSMKLAHVDLSELKNPVRFLDMSFPFYNKFI